MSANISQTAKAAQDAARQDTGEFGTQTHTESGIVDLPVCSHGYTDFCYLELEPVPQRAFDMLYEAAFRWAADTRHFPDECEMYAGWYAERFYPGAEDGELGLHIPAHSDDLFVELDRGRPAGEVRGRRPRSQRPHLARLDAAADAYKQDDNLKVYVNSIVEILGYTQRNDASGQVLVARDGREFEIPEAVGRNRPLPGDTMKILTMRLMSRDHSRNPSPTSSDFRDFLSSDVSWFMPRMIVKTPR